jgi:multicomponent Na+:H+ antiporter subunit D
MTDAWSPGSHQLVIWLLAPYLAAFTVALLPALSRPLILLCVLSTALLGAWLLMDGAGHQLLLLQQYGVSLSFDRLAGWFLLLNGLVCLAVWIEGRRQGWDRTGWLLLLVLLGALNTSFLTTDLVSLYVSLEVVAISAFLLILRGRTARADWIALRYLLVSNTAMGLYLIGAALVYAQSGSFQFAALAALPPGAPLALVLVGLLTKSGVFLNGLWLPRTHAEAPAEVSALLSGVVVSAGALPLLRLEQLSDAVIALLTPIALASAALGVLYALVVDDAKRLLAWSTLAQMGLVLLSPAAGGAMALSHGLAKAGMFLTALAAGLARAAAVLEPAAAAVAGGAVDRRYAASAGLHGQEAAADGLEPARHLGCAGAVRWQRRPLRAPVSGSLETGTTSAAVLGGASAQPAAADHRCAVHRSFRSGRRSGSGTPRSAVRCAA